MDVQVLHIVRTDLPLDRIHPDYPVLAVRPIDKRPQLDRTIGDLQVMKRAPEIACGHPEHVAHLGVDEHDSPISVNPDDRERRGFQREITKLAPLSHIAHLRWAYHIKPDRNRLVPGHSHPGPPSEHSLAHADDLEPFSIG